MTAIVVGALLAAFTLTFVLWPLFNPGVHTARAVARSGIAPPPQDSAVRALREIEFDRATGKLGDADYAALSAEYTARALAELRQTDHAAAAAVRSAADSAELLVQQARSGVRTCSACGAVCPEPDAVFCSTCGARLAA